MKEFPKYVALLALAATISLPTLGRADEVEDRLTALEDRATNLELRADQLESDAQLHEARISDLETRATNSEGRLDQVESDAQLHETRITSTETRLDALEVQASASGRTALFRDVEPSGIPGGTFVQDGWDARTLNYEAFNEIAGASLSANQITLPAGRYRVTARAQAYFVNSHRLRLYDATNAAPIPGAESINLKSVTAGNPFVAELDFTLVLEEPTAIELQHRCEKTWPTYGRGLAASFGIDEVYAEVFIEAL